MDFAARTAHELAESLARLSAVARRVFLSGKKLIVHRMAVRHSNYARRSRLR